MDWMKITPDEVDTVHFDSTFGVEGRDEQLEMIRDAYPEETKSEAQKKLEAAFDPTSEEAKGFNAAEAFNTDSPIEGLSQLSEDIDLDIDGSIFSKPPQRTLDATQFTEREKKAFKTDIPFDPYELELARKIKSPNLEDTIEAFQEINADPSLLAKFDTNGDGRYSYADMFDTSRWNWGDGITPEQDEEYTARWLNAVDKKSFAARWSRFGQNFPGVINKTEYLIDGRKSRLAPVDEVWNMDNNVGAGLLESSVGLLNLPQSALHWMSGGKLGGEEGKRLGDMYFQTSNPNSMAYTMMTPAKRHWSDGLWHEVGYWGSEAFQAYATLGVGLQAKAVTSGIKHLPRGQRLALGIQKFLKPEVTIKGSNLGYKLLNLGGTLTKTGFLETFKGAMTRDLSYSNMVGIYNENKLAKRVIDFHPDTWIFGQQLQTAIESPLGKRMSYWVDEGTQDSVFGGVMFGIFNPGKAFRFGGTALSKMRTGVSKFEWSASPLMQKNYKHYWNIRQQKGRDLARAGETQLELNLDPANPYNRNNALGLDDTSPVSRQNTKGAFKNPFAAADVGQGIVPTTSNPRQILNDADEIQGSLFTRKGSTDAILDPTDLSIAARHGVNGPIYQKLTKNFVEDATLAEQLKSLDPASRTIGNYGEGTFRRMQEIQGRDAAALEPREYWGDALLNQPLKAGSLEELDDLQKFVAEKLFVADAVNSSLLSQLRDIAAVTSEQLGKQDIFATDSLMKRVADNLAAGLSNVKQSRLTWSILGDKLKDADGRLSKEIIDEVNGIVKSRGNALHDETVDGVRLMMQMLKDSDSDELVDGLLDVFKVSNDIHNWKDFDAWMRQKIIGGEFKGKVKTGALIHELQGVMVNSILSGPKTPLRAILGTTTNTYLNAINEYAGALIREPFTNDIIARKAAGAKLKGMVEILPEAWQVFKENWNAKFTADFADIRTRYSEAPTRNDQNWELFRTWTERNGTDGEKAGLYIAHNAKQLNNWKLASWSPRALAATDDTYKWLMARARSKEIGMRKALEAAGDDWQSFSPELLKNAEDLHYRNLLDENGNLDFSTDSWLNKQFKEVTLTSEFNGWAKALDSLLNDAPLLKPFYLFARTGINGLNLSYKNTPLLGALHKESLDILKHSGDDFTPLMKYGIENANDLVSAKNLFAGRQAVGATVVTGIGMMYQSGQLTGNGPADRQLKQSWINANWKPNHIYFGNVGFNYSSLEPYNVIFSSIADIGDNIELMGSEWAEKRLQAVAFVLGRGLTSKTYMSGLDQLMQVVQMKPGAWNKTAANVLNNSIPLAGARNEFGKWINPYMKEMNSDMWTSIRNRNQATELIADKPLLPKYDILNGKPINNWNIIGRSFQAISPLQLDIRNNSPGRQLLLNSNYDLKTTTYSYGGYSLVRDSRVRSHFQNAIGSVPVTIDGKVFKNVEEALNHLSTRSDIKTSINVMKANINNPAKWDIDPTTYPHNTVINNVMDQARSKAWALINQPSHPAYDEVQELKAEQDGKTERTRENRAEILELNYPTKKQSPFPKR